MGILPNELKEIPQRSRPITILCLLSKTVNNAISTDNFYTVQMTARDTTVKVASQIPIKQRIPSPLMFSPPLDFSCGLNQTLR